MTLLIHLNLDTNQLFGTCVEVLRVVSPSFRPWPFHVLLKFDRYHGFIRYEMVINSRRVFW
jgi:hypothetical protein